VKENKLIFGIAVFVILLSTPVTIWTQDSSVINEDPNTLILSRKLGDQMLAFNAGAFLPLFTANPFDGTITGHLGNPDGMSLGANGTLRWGAFLNNIINIGLDLSWGFNLGPNGDFVSQFTPITARLSTFLRSGAFEFPLHLGLGMNILSYKNTTTLTPVVKAGASAVYNISPEWGFGLNLFYWWIPDIYTSTEVAPTVEETRFGNFLEISLSAIYNF
jgi:hypothetical protein